MQTSLSERQREILQRVVEDYVATGQPVGSRNLVERGGLRVSSSTVRSELAELETRGLLTHPHTSAGRVPTESGYRVYVQGLLERLGRPPVAFPLDLRAVQGEVETTLQETTEMLAEVTRLLALVSAPPLEPATVRHVEVLLLQPKAVMVVVITSTGGVGKRITTLREAVDPGLPNWARQYLNERVVGLRLGTHAIRQRLSDPALSETERAFLRVLQPAFSQLARDDQRLYVGGAAGFLDAARGDELATYRGVLEVLEKRAALLNVLSAALDPKRPFVRVGDDLEHPSLRDVALVGASYGLLNQTLGAVSLIGPLRMDYEKALHSVQGAAEELSRFAEDYYAEN